MLPNRMKISGPFDSFDFQNVTSDEPSQPFARIFQMTVYHLRPDHSERKRQFPFVVVAYLFISLDCSLNFLALAQVFT